MSITYLNFNGSILPTDHPIFEAHNRSFRYGDGLFESMRFLKGKLKFPEMHVDRIQKGMKLLKFDNYSLIDTWFIREKTEELIRRNKVGADARIRLTIFRDSGGFYTPDSNKFAYLLELNNQFHKYQYVVLLFDCLILLYHLKSLHYYM